MPETDLICPFCKGNKFTIEDKTKTFYNVNQGMNISYKIREYICCHCKIKFISADNKLYNTEGIMNYE